ncbi:hypothetical protein B7463_g9733, partial [Scytalidium lignicola]
MADYKSYLAARILSEDQAVTYRLLSRALKVNVNTAKQMLYDFHRVQNGKKPGTIHATYLISGTKKKEEITNGQHLKDGEDEHMQSSPFMSSLPQQEDTTEDIPVMTISLVREEDLNGSDKCQGKLDMTANMKATEVKAQYEHISCIHIYSLSPAPLKDIQVLSDVTREIQGLCVNEDPLEQNKVYGIILNKDVKRRTVRRAPAAASTISTAAPKAQPPKPKATDAKEGPKPSTSSSINIKKETKTNANDFFGKSSSTKAEPSIAEKKPPAALKRDSSKSDSSTGGPPAAASPAENSPLKGMDDDDDDEEDDGYVPPPQPSKEADSDRKSRKEREAALRRMMEDDDEEEVATPDVEMKEEANETEQEEKHEPEPEPEPTVTVSGGRRRGKRRVMKKKTVRDEEGYLVTKEEAVWESFSEDDAPAAPKRQQLSSGVASKPKKAAGKAGQGNIMSFFGKK